MPPPAQTAPATQVRALIKAILEAEFAGELQVKTGRMNDAHPGGFASVYPVSEVEGRRVLDQDTMVAVQVFLPWSARVDARHTVDPTPVEEAAERLREAVYDNTHPLAGTRGMWDVRVQRIDYLEDPSGQITRFVATIVAIGENFAETAA